MNSNISLIVILFFVITSLNAKDIVITNNGNKFIGEIIDRSEDKIIIRLNEDNVYEININDVKEISDSKDQVLTEGNIIDLSANKNNVINQNIDSENEIQYHQGGIHLMHPGLYNLNYAYSTDYIQFGFSLGSDFYRIRGFETSFLYLLTHKDQFKHGVQLSAGIQRMKTGFYPNKNNTDNYFALSYLINYYGFFMSLGLSYTNLKTLASHRYLTEFIYSKIGYSLKLR